MVIWKNLVKCCWWLLIATATATCVDPFDLGVSGTEPNLIIEALIHSDPGPYRVRLYRTVDLINQQAEQNAQVSVSDDQGNEYFFSEIGEGVYETNSFQGVIGRTYTLHIETAAGECLVSTPEKMPPVTSIDSIYLRRAEITEISDRGNEITTEGFNILLDSKSGDSGPSYYRWDYRGIFLLVTPDPCMFCPGLCFVRDTPSELLKMFGTTEPSAPIVGVNLGFFSTGIEWETSYRIYVRQYSLTQRAYDFWKAVDDQRNNTGSIFDPPPSIIVGNITNTSESSQVVQGLFQVSGVYERMLLISRADINELNLLFPNSFAVCDPGPNDPPAPSFCVNCLAFPESELMIPENIW